jgi:hypothetical protein
VHSPSPANQKSLIIIEAIYANSRILLSLGVILPGKVYIESWIYENLKGAEVLILSETGYTNNKIAV